LARRGAQVTLVTPGSDVSQWSYYTLEMRQIERRLHALGVSLICKARMIGADRNGADIVVGVEQRALRVPAEAILALTLRAPETALHAALAARRAEWQPAGLSSLALIGDANGPGTVAAAVHAGHRAARMLGSTAPLHVRRERTLLCPEPNYTRHPALARA
jgi:dimethylamine/trimethylamine dehydrogenase